MNKLLALALSFTCMIANPLEITFSVNDLSESDYLKYAREEVPSNLIIDNTELRNKYKRDLYLAKRFLNEISDEGIKKLNYDILQLLETKERARIISEEEAKITDTILYSYYIARQDNFHTTKTITLYLMEFNDEEEASKVTIETKPDNTRIYQNYEVSKLMPNYLLLVNELMPNTLSQVFEIDGKFIRFFYGDPKDARIKSFKESKEEIKSFLLRKKIATVFSEIFKGMEDD